MKRGKMDKSRLKWYIGLTLTVLFVLFTVWGPEALARYRDRNILNHPESQLVEQEYEGYRYALSSNEKLSILSRSINSQALPGVGRDDGSGDGYQMELGEVTGSYAFVVNHRDQTEEELTGEEVFRACNRELETLAGLGILPDTLRETDGESYTAVRYSAIYVPEPRNNVSVWRLTFSSAPHNVNKQDRLMDAYMDADTGRLYEFYVRSDLTWDQIDPDAMILAWSSYMGLEEPVLLGQSNPLQETTPYFRKYTFDGPEGADTVVTIGFYEGINELFLKISR